jgi:DNA invertase Pin-like site-specific DNA recombinase
MAASATLLPKNFPIGLMDGKFIAYYRVSTDHQGVNGNGMAAQRRAVEDYLNGGCWKLVGEFTEVESGKRSDRPELEKALKACRKHKAKLVIAKLDRLSRNVHFISGLMERKIDFVACDMPSADAFMINVYAAVAQEERRMISDRTKAALRQRQRELWSSIQDPGRNLDWTSPSVSD